ncbi:MAG: hypothetical protein WC179_08060, partial [Candidatus Cloacimonadaceae bacterium]
MKHEFNWGGASSSRQNAPQQNMFKDIYEDLVNQVSEFGGIDTVDSAQTQVGAVASYQALMNPEEVGMTRAEVRANPKQAVERTTAYRAAAIIEDARLRGDTDTAVAVYRDFINVMQHGNSQEKNNLVRRLSMSNKYGDVTSYSVAWDQTGGVVRTALDTNIGNGVQQFFAKAVQNSLILNTVVSAVVERDLAGKLPGSKNFRQAALLEEFLYAHEDDALLSSGWRTTASAASVVAPIAETVALSKIAGPYAYHAMFANNMLRSAYGDYAYNTGTADRMDFQKFLSGRIYDATTYYIAVGLGSVITEKLSGAVAKETVWLKEFLQSTDSKQAVNNLTKIAVAPILNHSANVLFDMVVDYGLFNVMDAVPFIDFTQTTKGVYGFADILNEGRKQNLHRDPGRQLSDSQIISQSLLTAFTRRLATAWGTNVAKEAIGHLKGNKADNNLFSKNHFKLLEAEYFDKFNVGNKKLKDTHRYKFAKNVARLTHMSYPGSLNSIDTLLRSSAGTRPKDVKGLVDWVMSDSFNPKAVGSFLVMSEMSNNFMMRFATGGGTNSFADFAAGLKGNGGFATLFDLRRTGGPNMNRIISVFALGSDDFKVKDNNYTAFGKSVADFVNSKQTQNQKQEAYVKSIAYLFKQMNSVEDSGKLAVIKAINDNLTERTVNVEDLKKGIKGGVEFDKDEMALFEQSSAYRQYVELNNSDQSEVRGVVETLQRFSGITSNYAKNKEIFDSVMLVNNSKDVYDLILKAQGYRGDWIDEISEQIGKFAIASIDKNIHESESGFKTAIAAFRESIPRLISSKIEIVNNTLARPSESKQEDMQVIARTLFDIKGMMSIFGHRIAMTDIVTIQENLKHIKEQASKQSNLLAFLKQQYPDFEYKSIEAFFDDIDTEWEKGLVSKISTAVTMSLLENIDSMQLVNVDNTRRTNISEEALGQVIKAVNHIPTKKIIESFFSDLVKAEGSTDRTAFSETSWKEDAIQTLIQRAYDIEKAKIIASSDFSKKYISTDVNQNTEALHEEALFNFKNNKHISNVIGTYLKLGELSQENGMLRNVELTTTSNKDLSVLGLHLFGLGSSDVLETLSLHKFEHEDFVSPEDKLVKIGKDSYMRTEIFDIIKKVPGIDNKVRELFMIAESKEELLAGTVRLL